MQDHWWLILLGAAIWTPMLIAMFRQPEASGGCPKCGHETGRDGSHCAGVEDYNDWCRCQHDYHWNYESVAS
jgi:hypothetical protein